MNKQTLVQRHSAGERVNHWLVALLFFLTAFSGLGFFHPGLFWLTSLFGGGTWARMLHPFFGSFLALCFLLLIARVWRDNRIIAEDWQWAKQMGAILRNQTEHLPAIGKYNLGQKLLTRTLLVSIVLLLASGVCLWQPWFAPEFTIGLRRQMVVLHAFAAFVVLLCVIVHIYAAYWTRGAIRSMTRGTVTTAWARHHSAAWFREQEEKVQ